MDQSQQSKLKIDTGWVHNKAIREGLICMKAVVKLASDAP